MSSVIDVTRFHEAKKKKTTSAVAAAEKRAVVGNRLHVQRSGSPPPRIQSGRVIF